MAFECSCHQSSFRVCCLSLFLSRQVNLGHMYVQGIGVPQNFSEALKWYTAASKQQPDETRELVEFAQQCVAAGSKQQGSLVVSLRLALVNVAHVLWPCCGLHQHAVAPMSNPLLFHVCMVSGGAGNDLSMIDNLTVSSGGEAVATPQPIMPLSVIGGGDRVAAAKAVEVQEIRPEQLSIRPVGPEEIKEK